MATSCHPRWKATLQLELRLGWAGVTAVTQECCTEMRPGQASRPLQHSFHWPLMQKTADVRAATASAVQGRRSITCIVSVPLWSEASSRHCCWPLEQSHTLQQSVGGH